MEKTESRADVRAGPDRRSGVEMSYPMTLLFLICPTFTRGEEDSAEAVDCEVEVVVVVGEELVGAVVVVAEGDRPRIFLTFSKSDKERTCCRTGIRGVRNISGLS